MIYFQNVLQCVKAVIGVLVFFQHNRNDHSRFPPPANHHHTHAHPSPSGNITASLIPRITYGRRPLPFGNQFRPLPPHQMLPPKCHQVKNDFEMLTFDLPDDQCFTPTLPDQLNRSYLFRCHAFWMNVSHHNR